MKSFTSFSDYIDRVFEILTTFTPESSVFIDPHLIIIRTTLWLGYYYFLNRLKDHDNLKKEKLMRMHGGLLIYRLDFFYRICK